MWHRISMVLGGPITVNHEVYMNNKRLHQSPPSSAALTLARYIVANEMTVTVKDAEDAVYLATLIQAGGNITHAAQRAKVGNRTFQRRTKILGRPAVRDEGPGTVKAYEWAQLAVTPPEGNPPPSENTDPSTGLELP